jgi:hypothetical protein
VDAAAVVARSLDSVRGLSCHRRLRRHRPSADGREHARQAASSKRDRPERVVPKSATSAPPRTREASEKLLPVRLLAALQAAPAPGAAPEALVEPIQQDADAPPAAVVYRGGPLEFDRIVPASGNLGVAGKQF